MILIDLQRIFKGFPFHILPFIIKLWHYLDQMNAEIYCQKFSSNLLECLSGSTMELLEDFDLVLPKRIK